MSEPNPSLPGSSVNNPLVNPRPIPATDGNHNEGNNGILNWITLVEPRPREGVITLRLERRIALDINFEKLPRRLLSAYSGIKIPSTRSVKNHADTTGGTLLEFCVHVYGATTKRRYNTVCTGCEKRVGKQKEILSLVDFHASCETVRLENGRVRVQFSLCCSPKCHDLGDIECHLDVVLSEDESQGHIVARCQLPFSFNVMLKPQGPRFPAKHETRKRVQLEQTGGAPPAPEPRLVQPKVVAQRNPPANINEYINHPAPGIDHHDTSIGAQTNEGNPSISPSLLLSLGPPRNADPSCSAAPIEVFDQAITPPITDEQRFPTLREVNPESRSITGGARVWLKGVDFPAHFPLYARFGTAVVLTTFSTDLLLTCYLPPATMPGVVDVTLSKHHQSHAPEYGTSVARFQYTRDQDQFLPIFLRIQKQGYPEFSPLLQALFNALFGHRDLRGSRGQGFLGGEPQDDLIETALVGAVECLQTRPNFLEMVSTTNECRQTLAHLSIVYGYPSLLRHLVDWRIDLAISDVNGLTALHCAYMKGDMDSVRILRRGGGSEAVMDKLGRTPLDLRPDGFNLDIDVGAEIDSEVNPEMVNNERLASGGQFSVPSGCAKNKGQPHVSSSLPDASEPSSSTASIIALPPTPPPLRASNLEDIFRASSVPPKRSYPTASSLKLTEAELYKRKILSRFTPLTPLVTTASTVTVDNGVGHIPLLGPASFISASTGELQRPTARRSSSYLPQTSTSPNLRPTPAVPVYNNQPEPVVIHNPSRQGPTAEYNIAPYYERWPPLLHLSIPSIPSASPLSPRVAPAMKIVHTNALQPPPDPPPSHAPAPPSPPWLGYRRADLNQLKQVLARSDCSSPMRGCNNINIGIDCTAGMCIGRLTNQGIGFV